MLSELRLQNLAIVDAIEISFQAGLNIITGETGSGKSLLVDALSLLRGGKFESDSIRTGKPFAQVFARFELAKDSPVLQLADDLGIPRQPDAPEELCLRRVCFTQQRSKSFINDTPLSLKSYQCIASELIDISSQFENQSLLDRRRHGYYLDAFAEVLEEASEFKTKFLTLHRLLKEWSVLEQSIAERERLLQTKRLLAQQIEEASLSEEDYRELQARVKTIQNAAGVLENLNQVESTLFGTEQNFLQNVRLTLRLIEKLSKSVALPQLMQIHQHLHAALHALEDVSFSLQKTTDDLRFDEQDLQAAQARLDEYHKFLHRHGPTLADVFRHVDEVSSLENEVNEALVRKEQMKEQLISLSQQLIEEGQILSKERRKAAPLLDKAVARRLETLGMPLARFSCVFTQRTEITAQPLEILNQLNMPQSRIEALLLLDEQGLEKTHFEFSANPGTPLAPLEKVASGGELSRTMLAIKSSLVADQGVGVFVFDEIDTGLSGKIAARVGKMLREFCRSRQVICITHLPQVASYAQSHFVVEKTVSSGQTHVHIHQVQGMEQVTELAKLLSGEKVTPESVAQAQQLMQRVQEVH